MKRWQASALHGGDMCRYWMVGNTNNDEWKPPAGGTPIPDKYLTDDVPYGPMYAQMCDNFKPDDNTETSSLLRSALTWCNERVDNAQGSTTERFELSKYRSVMYNSWDPDTQKCSDPLYTDRVTCINTKRKGANADAAIQQMMIDLDTVQKNNMLENVPSCLPDTYSNFNTPARACPRWTAAGSAGKFCRNLARAFPLQHDQQIRTFCQNPENSLLPACDCLSAEVVATKTKSNDPASPMHCEAADGAESRQL